MPAAWPEATLEGLEGLKAILSRGSSEDRERRSRGVGKIEGGEMAGAFDETARRGEAKVKEGEREREVVLQR